jgi:nucleotide-binding universal stress UspA family protein
VYRYENILVAMNLDEEDLSAVKFASGISHMAESREVHFYHVSDELDIPEKLCSDIEGLNMTCDTIIGQMQARVEKIWDGFHSTKLHYDASDGDVLKDILTYIKQKSIDLVIVQKICGHSKIPERLARKAPCSVLLVPPGLEHTLQNIFVATDFSQHSQEAVECAVAYAKTCGSKKITCVHVYSVPAGYHKTGHSYEEFSDILKENARDEYERMIGKMNLEGLDSEFIVDISKHPYQGIVDIVHGRKADLLIVAARGQSKTVAILLGSVTERLIDVCNVPILVVKKKGQGISLLEAMFGL